ncbi:MAG TPA: ribosome maturation factor RimP [Aquifex aeolicus]|uniref:Ribosome maturation factor RimP n=1 Tax=Aquifex aeolicus TaxID=63363 RepID=A0A7C5L3V9_AQUAO|nr:ribosome maturation factor RimP [Aquifex aeolicus]
MSVNSKEVSEKVKELVEPVIRNLGFRLFDVEFKPERGWVLRVIIDREGGVTIRDCEEVSRKISAILDVEDLIPFSYTLEISSPGLTRALEKPEHYAFFRGRLVKIVLREPVGERREITGYVEDVREGIITVRERERGEVLHIPFSAVARGRLEPEKW